MNTGPETTLFNEEYDCVLANHGLCVESSGRFKPCCKYKTWDGSINAYESPLRDLSQQASLQKIREDLGQQIKHEGCRRCWEDEKSGVESFRQSNNRRFSYLKQGQHSGIKLADFGFGNLCNAACITCESSSSHLWSPTDEKLEELPGNPFDRKFFKKLIPSIEWSEEDLTNLDNLIFAQTEVLASPAFPPFLKAFTDKPDIEHKNLFLSTNGSIWPKPEILDCIKKFNSSIVQISIDALGEKNNYIRHPLRWQRIEENIHKWIELSEQTNVDLSLRCTVSIYNILEVEKLKTWWQELAPKAFMSIGFCWYPNYLQAEVFADQLRPYIEKQYSSVPELRKININQPADEKKQKLFWDFTAAMDQERGLNFSQQFPELFAIIS